MSQAFDLNSLKNAFANQNQGSNEQNDRWAKYYSFWKMDFGEQAVVRFLPDADQDNPLGFITENVTHKITVNGKQKTIPCLSMYGKQCPCCDLSRKYYDEEGDNSANGRKYWKKREYLAAVIVRNSPIDIENAEETKIVGLGPKIYKSIQEAFASGDLENPPFWTKGGHDFRIKKTQQGEYADYSLSSFAPRPSDLTEQEMSYVEEITLSDLRTPEMSVEKIEAMLVAAETGAAMETGTASNGGDSIVADALANLGKSSPQENVQEVQTETVQQESQPTETVTTEKTQEDAADSGDMNAILEQIRNRANA